VFLNVKFLFLRFHVSLDYFAFMLLVSFVGFGFFSVASQETGCEEGLRYDLFCVE